MPGHFRREQRRLQRGRLGGENRESLVEIGIHGRLADRVIDGQLPHPGAVEKPAQHQDGLLDAGQDPTVLAGAAPHTFGVQQARQVQHGLVAYRQRRGVCHTHQARDPHEVDLW